MVVLPFLKAGQSLQRGQNLISPNLHFKLTHQFDGNFNLYRKGTDTALWSTDTEGKDTRIFKMKEDGNLVLCTATDELWSSETCHKGGIIVRIQDDGNFVVYTDEGKDVWGSKSYVGVIYRSDMSIGEMSKPGTSLVSKNKHNKAMFTDDEKLVVSNSGIYVWQAISCGKGGQYLVFQNDGNLVIYDYSSTEIWSPNIQNSGA